MPEESDLVQVPVSWVGVDETPILLVNQFLGQFQQDEFVLTFGRHRAKLLQDDSLLECVAGNSHASTRLKLLAESQERYRRTAAFRTVTVWEARQFEAGVRRLDEDGEPLPLVVL